jgi:hypothetical protein
MYDRGFSCRRACSNVHACDQVTSAPFSCFCAFVHSSYEREEGVPSLPPLRRQPKSPVRCRRKLPCRTIAAMSASAGCDRPPSCFRATPFFTRTRREQKGCQRPPTLGGSRRQSSIAQLTGLLLCCHRHHHPSITVVVGVNLFDLTAVTSYVDVNTAHRTHPMQSHTEAPTQNTLSLDSLHCKTITKLSIGCASPHYCRASRSSCRPGQLS